MSMSTCHCTVKLASARDWHWNGLERFALVSVEWPRHAQAMTHLRTRTLAHYYTRALANKTDQIVQKEGASSAVSNRQPQCSTLAVTSPCSAAVYGGIEVATSARAFKGAPVPLKDGAAGAPIGWGDCGRG